MSLILNVPDLPSIPENKKSVKDQTPGKVRKSLLHGYGLQSPDDPVSPSCHGHSLHIFLMLLALRVDSTIANSFKIFNPDLTHGPESWGYRSKQINSSC